MQISEYDFMKTRTTILGNGLMPDTDSDRILQNRPVLENRDHLSSFFSYANFHRNAAKSSAKRLIKSFPWWFILGNMWTFYCSMELSLFSSKQRKPCPISLAQPIAEGHFILDTTTSVVALSGILHQEKIEKLERYCSPYILAGGPWIQISFYTVPFF